MKLNNKKEKPTGKRAFVSCVCPVFLRWYYPDQVRGFFSALLKRAPLTDLIFDYYILRWINPFSFKNSLRNNFLILTIII